MHPRQQPGDQFNITRPLTSHWRQASCAEVACVHYLNGWQTAVPVAGPQADYIRHQSRRRFTETAAADGLVVFIFEAGQACFRRDQHRLPLERSPLFLQQRPGQPRMALSWPEWADRFNDSMQTAARRR